MATKTRQQPVAQQSQRATSQSTTAQSTPRQPTDDEIRARAIRYYEEAGAPEGRDEEFWLRAERDLRQEEPASNDPRTPAPASTRETSASSGEELS